MVTRDQIKRTLEALNEAENNVGLNGVDETIAAIDRTQSPSVVGWTNGEHRPNREAERQVERVLFAAVANYHRVFDRMIVDPPFAAVGWRITGTDRENDRTFELHGSSQFEFLDSGEVGKYWVYVDMSQFAA